MYEFIGTLESYYVAEVLIVLAVLLVRIDYFFPTDLPAHIGYFFFGAGMFFVLPLGVLPSIAMALGIWILLAILHQLWFKRFLANVSINFLNPCIRRDASVVDEQVLLP